MTKQSTATVTPKVVELLNQQQKELFFKHCTQAPLYETLFAGRETRKLTRWERMRNIVGYRWWLARRKVALWICPSLEDD